jgi:hypothetical protein
MLRRFKFSIFLAGAAAVAVTAGSCQADEAMLQSPHFATPVAAAELDNQRGKALPDCDPCTLGNMSAVVTGNSSVGDLTGNNVIGDGALSNASGAFLAVQNVGNNVVIQTNMSVDVNFVQ